MRILPQVILDKLLSFEKHFPDKGSINLKDAIDFIEASVQKTVDLEFIVQFLREKGYKVNSQPIEELKSEKIQPTFPLEQNDEDFDLDDILNLDLQPTIPEGDHASNPQLLASFHKNKDFKIYQLLIQNNISLVKKIAAFYINSYGYHKLSYEDLVSEGIVGLSKAIKKFDPSKGTQFSTYATIWIRQSITRAIWDTGTTVRVPIHMVETIMKVKRAEKQYILENNELDIDQICDLLGMTKEKYAEAKRVEYQFLNMASLNTYVSDAEDAELGDFMGNEKQQIFGFMEDEYSDPINMVEKSLLRHQLFEILEELKDREREILIQRFGLADNRAKTLEEIGDKLGLTRERIRQIENKAIGRLRARMRKHYKEWKAWIS